jgi:hypothetical protein
MAARLQDKEHVCAEQHRTADEEVELRDVVVPPSLERGYLRRRAGGHDYRRGFGLARIGDQDEPTEANRCFTNIRLLLGWVAVRVVGITSP